jgi:Gpi18-like mannosyltransferase
MKNIMVLAIISRIFIFATAVASNAIFGTGSCEDCWNIEVPFFNLFSRWDSGYYADIALGGYGNIIGPEWEFFPGYPILISIFGRVLVTLFGAPIDTGVYIAGFAVSNFAFFVSVYYLYKLTSKILDDARLAYNSALLLAFYPAGVFLSAVYSESIFLMLTISSLYYWRLEKLNRSALLGFFAALTRPVGIFLLVPYLYELLVDSSRRRAGESYLPVVSILLG